MILRSNERIIEMDIDPIAWLLIVAVALGVSYGAFKLERNINYQFDYKDRVLDSIKNNVKEECLK